MRRIVFLGVDGSGKSTLSKEVAAQLRGKYCYFGWQPFLPTTKLFSRLFRSKNYSITEDLNAKKKSFSLTQEIVLCYFFIEYLARYLFAHGKIVVFDRYFYDIYAHYSYAERSVVFPVLLRLFPRPDRLYILDVAAPVAHQRKPEMSLSVIETHRNRYLALAQKLKARVLLTNKPVQATLTEILEDM